jgi:hypothetical protein
MPNWCDNTVLIKGPTEAVKALKDKLQSAQTSLFDFNAIKPMPQALINTTSPAHMHENQQKVAFNIKNYGAPDWYTWANNEWGTKWNASDVALHTDEALDDKTHTIGYSFQTAWAPAIPVYEELAKQHPELDIHVSFDECGVGFSGWRYYSGGELSREEDYEGSYYNMRMHMEPDSEIWEYL